jgi:hypothetical protein
MIVSSNLARPFEVDVQVVMLVVDQPTYALILDRTVTPSASPFFCFIVPHFFSPVSRPRRGGVGLLSVKIV